MTKPGSVSLLLDHSGSMSEASLNGSTNTKLELAQTDTNTFIVIAYHTSKNTGSYGQIGVIGFDTTPSTTYALHTFDGSGTVKHAANQAVNGLSATGATGVKAAIASGATMLQNVNTSTYNRAMVLFSDGMWNWPSGSAGDPTKDLPTGIPIYSIGYGSSSYLSYLKTIAQNTGGKYHITGNPGVLKTYYTDIMGATNGPSVITNAAWEADEYDFNTQNVVVSQGMSSAIFTASWNADNLTYVSGTPGPGQIAVQVRDPQGRQVTPTDVDAPVGGGYAVLSVANPVAGTWTLTLRTANLPGSVGGTSGPFVNSALAGFGPPSATQVALTPQTGELLAVNAQVTDAGQPVHGAHVHAYAVHPLHGHDELLAKHESDVKRIISENDFDEDANKEAVALRILDKERPDLRLTKQVRKPATVEPKEDGTYDIKVDGHKPGVEHTVYAVVNGHAPVSNNEFQRTKLLTVIP
ncbi:MAG: vWA domain-containing protein [Acidobacteriota bacterium]